MSFVYRSSRTLGVMEPSLASPGESFDTRLRWFPFPQIDPAGLQTEDTSPSGLAATGPFNDHEQDSLLRTRHSFTECFVFCLSLCLSPLGLSRSLPTLMLDLRNSNHEGLWMFNLYVRGVLVFDRHLCEMSTTVSSSFFSVSSN